MISVINPKNILALFCKRLLLKKSEMKKIHAIDENNVGEIGRL